MTDEPANKRTEVSVYEPASGQRAQISDLPAAIVQALYNEATGKQESIFRSFSGNFIVSSNDIEQLLDKIQQTGEQYDIRGVTESIVVAHKDDDSIRYSSKQKFLEYDKSRTSPVSGITITIKFLLAVPITRLAAGIQQKFKDYEITVNIQPSIILPLSEGETIADDHRYHSPTSNKSVRFSIDYVDYVVARSFQSAIESWVKGLETFERQRGVRWFSKNRNAIFGSLGDAGGAVAALAAAFMGFKLIDVDLGLTNFGYWLLLPGTAFLIFRSLMYLLFYVAHESVFLLDSITIAMLNRGDERNREKVFEIRSNMPRRIFAIVGSAILALVLNCVAALIVH